MAESESSRDAPTKPEPVASRRGSESLDERFEHLREIARGGMGRVVEARDRHLGRIVAVKESLDNHPDSLLRFEREVAITARLEHPSIVPVYDAGVASDGTPFYVMRRVSGAPFDQLIRRATTLDRRLTLLPHVLAVADAIAHAHQRGVIHRDIKPSNVLVGELGETVVIDWGLAKMLDEPDEPGVTVRARGSLETAAGTVIGTPGFMAPEQIGAGTTDARSDVYALGACLYYLLAGRTPFHGSTEDEVLERTRRGTLDPLERGVPKELVTIVGKAMATAPAERYIDAGGFSEDLRRFLGGQLVAAHRYPPLQRVGRWLSRHRTAAVAVLGVAIAASVAGVLVRRLGAERARTESRSDDVVIVQATEQVAGDPTRAIAILSQLRPDSPRWPSLAPLLANARARGIATGYPGHNRFDLVRFAPDPTDARALTSGSGVLRLLDLATQTSTIVSQGSRALQGWWLGSLVLYNPTPDKPLRLLDPRTHEDVELAWSSTVTAAVTGGATAAFTDNQHRVLTLDAGSTTPIVVAAAKPAKYVDLSPSGKTLLVYTPTSTQIFRRDGDWKLVTELDTFLYQPTYDAREERLAIRTGTTDPLPIVELDLASGRELRRWEVPSSIDLEYAGSVLYVAGNEQLYRLEDGGKVVPLARVEGASPSTLAHAGGWLVVLETPRRIAISRGSFRREIRTPLELIGIGVDPAGRYLLGIGGGTTLAWDLSAMLPQYLPGIDAETIVFRDADSIVTTNTVDISRRIDSYRFTPAFTLQARANVGTIPVMDELFTMAGGVLAVRDRVNGLEHSFEAPIDKRDDLSAIAVVDDATFVVGTRAARVERIDRKTGEVTLLGTLDKQVAAVAANAAWVVAQSYTGAMWRRGGGRESSAALVDPMVGVEVTRDGTVYVAQGTKLLAWPPEGKPTAVTDLGNEIATMRLVVGGRVAIITADHSLHVYDPATGVRRLLVNGTFASPGTDLDMSEDGRFAATHDDGGLGVVELASGGRWSLADRLETKAIALSPDGRYLIASDLWAPGLFRFDLTPPPATAAWAKAVTNVLPLRSPTAVLEWRSSP